MENQESKSRPHEEIVASIKAVIETHVKPAVAGHGGTVNFVEFKDGLLTLQMSGACSGCAGSKQTLQFGIENMMKHYVPEVLAIEGEDDPNFNDPYYDRWAGFDNIPEDA